MKKSFCLLLSIIFVLAFSASAFAADRESQLLNTEKATINGQDIIIRTYDDQGVIVETVEIVGDKSKFSEEELSESLDKRAMENSSVDETVNPMAVPLPLGTWYSSAYNIKKDSSINTYHTMRIEGALQRMTGNPYRLRTYEGYMRQYHGPVVPDNMQFSETYTFNGFAVSVGWPGSWSVSPSVTSYTWSSLGYPNTTLATAYRLTIASESIFKMTLTQTTRADVYDNSTMYPLSIQISKSN